MQIGPDRTGSLMDAMATWDNLLPVRMGGFIRAPFADHPGGILLHDIAIRI
jgi:hypothetical protein